MSPMWVVWWCGRGETARKETRAFLAKKPVGIEAGKLEIRKGLR